MTKYCVTHKVCECYSHFATISAFKASRALKHSSSYITRHPFRAFGGGRCSWGWLSSVGGGSGLDTLYVRARNTFNVLLMNNKNFIKDCLYINASTKL